MKLSHLAKRMIFTIIIISVICTILSVVYYRSLEFLPFLFGIILGSGLSIYKVLLLEKAVDKALDMENKRAGSHVAINHMLRLLLSGLALFIGAIVDQISLWGVVAGILSFQLSLYSLKGGSKNGVK